MNLQELTGRLLKTNSFVYDRTEYENGNERDWYVDQSQCDCFNEGVIESCLLMPVDYGALRKKR
jgi:hypothetical protein